MSCQPSPIAQAKSTRMPLRLLLIVPFVLQIFAAVGLVGYLSFRNGQRAVNDIAKQVIDSATQRVDNQLDTYLALPQQIAEVSARTIAAGQLDLKDPQALERYFWRQAKVFKTLSYLGYTLPDGNQRGAGRWTNGKDVLIYENLPGAGKAADYTSDEFGNRASLIQRYDYDPLQEAWYSKIRQAKQPFWADIYAFVANNFEIAETGQKLQSEGATTNVGNYSDYVVAPARYPLLDQNGKFQGSLEIDLQLSHISNFLRELKISPSGQVFILERDGQLVASSGQQSILNKSKDKAERFTVSNVPDPLIQAVAQQTQQNFAGFRAIREKQEFEFQFNGHRQFVQVTPWKDAYGLNWLVVVTLPESDFMAQINANTRTTILLCLAALGIATVLGIYTSRWITRPISRLKIASQAIASGDLNQQINLKGIDELESLGNAFNQMAAQLKTAFTELETRVEERTIELKAAKLAADSANQAKSEFLANMSHELRTPLNGILGYAQILSRSKALPDQERHGVGIIHQCGTHLLTLINDILDLSKIEARRLELAPKPLHFPSFLQGVVEICRVRADQKGIAFHYYPDDHLPVGITVDEKRLRQVLINLLGNAIKFTDQGSVTFRVEQVTADAQSARLRFVIADTGVGIAPEDIAKLFQAFEQVGEQSRRLEGTGLGLVISQQIVQLMEGQIQIKSQLGAGSDFFFEVELPLASDWQQQTVAASNIIGYEGAPRHLLVVDDRWENRAVLVNLLEPLGFVLTQAQDGQDGLDRLRQTLPDLVITDLTMPIMDGFEMLRRLRAADNLNHLKVIVSSASVAQLDQQMSLDAGGDDFLAKPVQADELFQLLAKHLDLTWKYAEAAEAPSAMQQVAPADLTPPPTADLQRLLELAQEGRLKKLAEVVQQIGQGNARYQPFVQQVVQLAQQFQSEQIEQLLHAYLTASMEDNAP